MDQECKDIKKNAFKYSSYLRGGVSYEVILNMSPDERMALSQIVEENLETTKKTQLPFF